MSTWRGLEKDHKIAWSVTEKIQCHNMALLEKPSLADDFTDDMIDPVNLKTDVNDWRDATEMINMSCSEMMWRSELDEK